MSNLRELPLVAIVGPTASGKSALAVSLALKLGGEVMACDSTQLYRGFNIGTAKPNLEERHGVSHHLIDVLDANQEATAGGYREMAINVLEELRSRGRLPILTVGTGLYLRALLEGLADIPKRCDSLRERLKASAAENAAGHLHRMLQRLDPMSAGRIAPADTQKLVRAVEVCLLTKRPLSEVHSSGKVPLRGWKAIKLGLAAPREALYARVEARTDAMLAQGWLEEVRALTESGLGSDAKPFDFIGYRELRAVLRNEMLLEEARNAIQQATRRYAKRQMTWFRREAEVHWLSGFGDDAKVQETAEELVRAEVIRGVPERGALDV